MNKLGSMAAMAIAALALAGCGGSGSSSLGLSGGGSGSGGGGGGGGSGSGGTKTYSMGNGSGSSFQSGMIGISSTSLSAGGTTSLTVAIVDQTGALYTSGAVTVTFSSTCISQALASVTASGSSSGGTNPDTVITSTGTANATYTAKGCSGADVITASATVGTTSLTATGTVTVAAAATGSIQFESAQPSTIGLKGTGQPSTSVVTFKVVDAAGGPKQGVTVNFALDSVVGGLSLSPSSATSAADGTVQTIVSSGTVHASVTVTATIASPALSTRSSQLTVTTGIPASNTFTIAAGPAQYSAGLGTPPACPNVEAWDIEGVVVPITVSLADRYNNPVLDGTAVSFFTDGGKIDGSCKTGSGSGGTGPGTGACTVNWTSANPQPTPIMPEPSTSSLPGRVVILATAIGEESFTDNSGSGFYQSGDPFVNLGEPYDNSQELNPPQYVQGDNFLDFNHNGQWDKPPSPAQFVGITCTGSSATDTCTTNTLALGAQQLIIMSSGTIAVKILGATGAFSYSGGNSLSFSGAGGTGTVTFQFESYYADYTPPGGSPGLAANPIPAGTTIGFSTSGSIGTLSSASTSFTEPCSTSPQGDSYTITLTGVPTSGSGSLNVAATSAGTKAISQFSIPVT